MNLYDFQEADVRAFLEHDGTGAIAADTGAGKTLIMAETLARSGARTKFIIAPQGTHKKVWRRTIIGDYNDDGVWEDGRDPEARVRRIAGDADGKQAMSDLELGEPGYYLMTPQLFTRWKPEHVMSDYMVVDEAHLLGNRDAAGGKLLRKMASVAGSRAAMSGTLDGNRFENRWNIMRFLWPHLDGPGQIADISANRWIDTFCRTEYDHFAPGNRKVVGELYSGQVATLAPLWCQHFKRAECCEFHLATEEYPTGGFLAHLPEPIVIRETVELTAGQKRAMTQMQKDYLSYLDLATEEWLALPKEERKKRALVTKMPIVRETRLSQMTLAMPSIVPRPAKPDALSVQTEVDGKPFTQACDDRGIPLWDVVFAPDAESPKFDRLVEIYRKHEEPIVAATNSQKFAELAVNRLNAMGIRAFEWSGNFTQTQRDAALDDLKAGRLDIIVGVTAAIGTGIDGLQDAAGIAVSLNKDRNITNEVQFEGRLDRRGQLRADGVIHYEIIAEGSTDENVIDGQLQRRLDLNRSLRKEITRQRR